MVMFIVVLMGVLALIAIDRQHRLMDRRMRARVEAEKDRPNRSRRRRR
ncbi:MAG: hypothetical protein R3176_05235 [Woeseiaceae bacterium]|nr:hypothetical protein [Woeseiaceae bacterium]